MCKIWEIEQSRELGYAGAAVNLWLSGQKKAAIWLMIRSEHTLAQYREMGVEGEGLYVLRLIFAAIERLERKETKLSHSDSPQSNTESTISRT